MTPLSLPTLLSHLRQTIPFAQIQEETNQIVFTKKIKEWEFPTFLRILPENTLLQIITFFPFSLDETVKSDVARLLHLLNKQLDLPGLGMDELSNTIYYRLVIPSQTGKINLSLLDTYLQAVDSVTELFAELVGVVASGALSIDTLLKQMMDAGEDIPTP